MCQNKTLFKTVVRLWHLLMSYIHTKRPSFRLRVKVVGRVLSLQTKTVHVVHRSREKDQERNKTGSTSPKRRSRSRSPL